MSTLSGTWQLIRLILRRDRLRLPIWLLAILGVVYASAQAVQVTYDTPAAIASYAGTMSSSAAAIAMSGPPTALQTTGGITIFEINTTAIVAVALMAIFLVVRHTRAEEEAGRTELMRSTVVGRHAPTLAALLVVGSACLVVGAGITLILLSFDLPTSGALVHGTSIGLLGLAFTAIGAAAAQVTANARGALGIASAVLGASYILRAAGDVGNGVLSWLSPIGWAQAAEPFGADRWWPLLLLVVFVALALGLAAELTTHRDVGAGLVPARAGPAHASPRLLSAVGLAARLQRGSVIGWAVGMFIGGIAFGSFGREVTSMVEGNPEIAEFLAQEGAGSLVDAYFAAILAMLAIVGAGFTVSSALRMRGEESTGRVEPLLATGLSRSRWLAGSLTVTVVGTAFVMAVAGLGVGLAHGLATDDMGQLPRLLGAMFAYTPAVLVLGGLAVLLFGWLPRAAAAAWAVLAGCLVIAWLGGLLEFPGWMRDLSPFVHTPEAPVDTVTATPLVLLVAIAVAAAGLGLAGLRRRDIG